MASLASVKEAADRLLAKAPRIDLLFANAGVMATDRQTTADGFEGQIGVCHYGHFALVGHLLPALHAARIVTTTSSAAWFGKMDFDDINSERHYSRYGAYYQAKLANVLFTFELDRRFKKASMSATANSAHPGFVYGHLQEQAMKDGGAFERFFYRVIVKHWIAIPVEEGVKSLLLAASPEEPGGGLYGPRRLIRGPASRVTPPRRCRDTAAAEQLWKVSEALTGRSYL